MSSVVKALLAATIVAALWSSGAATAHAQLAPEPVSHVGGPARQHFANALRLVVSSSDYATLSVRGELPTIRYDGRPAY